MYIPSTSYTKNYFEHIGGHLSKRPSDHPMASFPWHLEISTWPGSTERNFSTLKRLWYWWAEDATIRLSYVRLINAILPHYAEADHNLRKEMRFYLFNNYYAANPLPRPSRPWDSVGQWLKIGDLPRNWKSWMLNHCQERGLDFDFRCALGDALDNIDLKHPNPLWVERVPRLSAAREIASRPRL